MPDGTEFFEIKGLGSNTERACLEDAYMGTRIETFLANRSMKRDERTVARLNKVALAGPASGLAPLSGAMDRYPDGGDFKVAEQILADPNLIPKAGRPDEHFPYAQVGEEGRKFLSATRSATQIAAVTGKPAQAPFRFYEGLLSGKTVDERTAAVMKSLLTRKNDQGETAFDQDVLVLAPSTGSGFVESVGVNTVENALGGKSATIGIQYNDLASFLSLAEMKLGVHQTRALLKAINAELQARAGRGEHVPKLFMLGESLGAAVGYKALEPHQAELANPASSYHVDNTLFTGLPGFLDAAEKQFSGQKYEQGHFVNQDGSVIMVDPTASKRFWPQPGRINIANNKTDPVPRFGNWRATFFRPFNWPADQKFIPVVSKVGTVVNINKNTHPLPGQFAEIGHDYRQEKVNLVNHFLFGGKLSPELVKNTNTREMQAEKDRAVQDAVKVAKPA